MSNESSPENLIPSTQESEQLKAEIPRIVALRESPPEDSEDLEDILWVDFDSGEEPEKGIKGAGPESYVISPVSEQNLFSDKYINCTGVVGIGRDKVSGKNIAFISHQDPEFIVNKSREETDIFKTDLKATLKELLARSETGTVEVVIFGGNDDPSDSASKKSTDYRRSVELLNEIIRDGLGHDPAVLVGPNHGGGSRDVTVITKNRKIYIK